ncbi:MAG: hypothetical protein J2P41_04040 [Blastocatellia bacterium]|nr:hypothetical protein [Blastocatellia bacterium]
MAIDNVVHEKRFGPRIVATWFETVINPLLQGLSVEQQRLSKKSWTWQFIPGRLESIRYIREIIPSTYLPNLEQFVRFHPGIKEYIDIHDYDVTQLSDACKDFQQVLMDSDDLKNIFERVTSDKTMLGLGVSLKSERLGWIAEAIINGAGELPTYINHSPLWNRHREEFLHVLEHPAARESKLHTDRTGEKLHQTVEQLIKRLTETRDELSLNYDIPPVPTDMTLVG